MSTPRRTKTATPGIGSLQHRNPLPGHIHSPTQPFWKQCRQCLGARGEAAVAAHCAAKGDTVLARNWRHGRLGELDLVIRDGDTVAAVEVKTRSGTGYGNPFEAIGRDKLNRIRLLLAEWLRRNQAGCSRVRVDAAAVLIDSSGSARIDYVAGVQDVA